MAIGPVGLGVDFSRRSFYAAAILGRAAPTALLYRGSANCDIFELRRDKHQQPFQLDLSLGEGVSRRAPRCLPSRGVDLLEKRTDHSRPVIKVPRGSQATFWDREMECKCENGSIEDAGAWLSGKNARMGAFAVVGYLLYRFSQTLPALIRWPIRVFCTLTGLSALWAWVSRIVGTLRVIRNLCKWLAKMWKLLKASSSKFHWIVPMVTGSSPGSWDGHKMDLSSPLHAGLRVIVVGPAGGGRTSVANLLLGRGEEPPPSRPLAESVLSRSVVDGRELVVVDTPDLLGASLGRTQRAREALRSLRLAAPGPHAVLLVMPTSGEGTSQEAAARAVLELLGDDVRGHVVPVLTRVERRRHDSGAAKKLAAVCGQSPELLDAAAADGSPEERGATRRALVGRVLELKEVKGHFVHELHRRDERLRTELLDDMTSALGQKLKK